MVKITSEYMKDHIITVITTIADLPLSLIAQLVAKHCTGITDVLGSTPIQPENLFQALISQLLRFCSSVWIAYLY